MITDKGGSIIRAAFSFLLLYIVMLQVILLILLLFATDLVAVQPPVSDVVIWINSNHNDVSLAWSRPPLADHFLIYSGGSCNFQPDAGSLVGTTSDTSFTHLNGLAGVTKRFYAVIAVGVRNGDLHDPAVAVILPVSIDGVQTRKNATWAVCRNQNQNSVAFSTQADTLMSAVADSGGHYYRLFRASFISDTVNSGNMLDSFPVAAGNYARVDSVQLKLWVHSGIDSQVCANGIYAVLIKDSTPTVYAQPLSLFNYCKYRSTGWKEGATADSSAFDSLDIPMGQGDHELIFRSEAYTARFDTLLAYRKGPCQYFVQIVSCSDYTNTAPTPEPGITFFEKLFCYYSESDSIAKRPYFKIWWSEMTYPLTAGELTEVSHGTVSAILSWTSTPGGVSERLQQRSSDTSRWCNIDDAATSPFIVTGLTTGTEYDFRVAYLNATLTDTVFSNMIHVSTVLSEVAPYDQATVGSANVNGGTQGAREFLSCGHSYRIRQEGTVRSVRLYAESITGVEGLYIKIWRKPMETIESWDLVGMSENISDRLIAGDVATIDLTTPIQGVKEGDFIGYRLEESGNDSILFAKVVHAHASGIGDSICTFYLDTASTAVPPTTYFSWTRQARLDGVAVPIELYMSPPQAVFVGNSIISGCCAHYSFLHTEEHTSLMNSVSAQFKLLTGFTYQNMGINANTTPLLVARFTHDVLDLSPELLVLEGGINDLRYGEQKTEFINNWAIMLSAVQAKSSIRQIMVIKIPPCNVSWGCDSLRMSWRDNWNASLDSLASLYSKTTVVDVSPYVGQYRAGGAADNLWDIIPEYTLDGIHYNTAGYARWAQALQDSLH
jgi:lysophospholipase L1-like esterase